ncbi:Alkaline ceramidase 3 [Dinochytrium kinnereticum]|nr:Alkaline ceramidase 3 [Dinochytrium kinnereticum]
MNRSLTALGLALYGAIVTILYLYIINPVFHEVCYGLLVAVMVFMPISQISFAIWNIENLNCDALRALRAKAPSAVRPFMELHAWWHFGTAVGTYGSILLQTYLRLLALGRRDVKLAWLPLPVIVSSLSRAQILKELEKKKKKRE